MSDHIVKRGYVDSDVRDFNFEQLNILNKAQNDIFYLIEHGYPIKNASTFVGNHYLLTERQRLALTRATCTSKTLENRKIKKLVDNFEGKTVFIDGLNQIITLEVALSESTLIYCMDGTIRDLAGLRGTYRLIDKTDIAIQLIADQLKEMNIKKVIFYLDSPVSNTGKLKTKIYELLASYPFEVSVELVDNADVILETKDFVVTSDSIILNKCNSWINLIPIILDRQNSNTKLIDLTGKTL